MVARRCLCVAFLAVLQAFESFLAAAEDAPSVGLLAESAVRTIGRQLQLRFKPVS